MASRCVGRGYWLMRLSPAQAWKLHRDCSLQQYERPCCRMYLSLRDPGTRSHDDRSAAAEHIHTSFLGQLDGARCVTRCPPRGKGWLRLKQETERSAVVVASCSIYECPAINVFCVNHRRVQLQLFFLVAIFEPNDELVQAREATMA